MKLKNKPFVFLQQEMSDCGLVSLAAAAALFGVNIDINELKNNGFYSLRGMKISDIKKIAEEIGLVAIPVKYNGFVPPPATIILVDGNHYWVTGEVNGEYMDVFDPNSGWINIKIKNVINRISGLALEISPGTAKKSKINSRFVVDWMFESVNKKALVLPILFSVFSALALLISPKLTQKALEFSSTNSNLNENINSIIIGLVASGLAAAITSSISSIISSRAGKKIKQSITEDLISKTFNMPASFFERQTATSVMNRLSIVSIVYSMIISTATGPGIKIIIGLTSIIIIGLTSKILMLLAIITGAMSLFTTYIFKSQTMTVKEKSAVTSNKYTESLEKTISAYIPIKLFGGVGASVKELGTIYGRANDAELAENMLDVKVNFFNSIQAMIFSIATLLACMLLISSKVITMPEYVALMWYFGMVAAAFSSIQSLWSSFFIIREVDGRVGDILKNKKIIKETKISENFAVELRNINFAYSKFDKNVINNLNLNIIKGETVVIKAPTGFGKTTLAKIILGILDPSSGEVMLSKEIAEGKTSCVMQSDSLLTASIESNISFFRKTNKEEIIKAAKDAEIFKDIDAMPMRFETMVGEDISVVSGGQRQRILLARALLASPDLIILDEATSALDIETENKIVEHLKLIKSTKIIFTHRESVCKIADRVLDLKDLVSPETQDAEKPLINQDDNPVV